MPTGLHTPVTNIVASEATVASELLSEGSNGFGKEQIPAEGAVEEAVTRFESMEAVEAPDTTSLADIGVASFGPPPQFETILGTDERVRIGGTEEDATKLLPWRLSASLLITAADNSQWIGTGWFISPRTLATAGHCVYIKNSGVPGRDGWVKKIQVMPGRDAAKLPFGARTSTEFWTVKGWSENGMETFDYAAIILPSKFEQDLGSFSFGVFPDDVLLAAMANIAGYPGDKPSGTLWYDRRKVGSVMPAKVFYAADTAGGQSGACVYMIRNGTRIGIAVHAYGGQTSNSGTRISNEVFENLTAWKQS